MKSYRSFASNVPRAQRGVCTRSYVKPCIGISIAPARHATAPVTAMNAISKVHVRGHNRLLDLLPQDVTDRLLPEMERISTRLGDMVFERNQPVTHVDFPLGAIISIVVIMEDGAIVEAGTVGNEGMAGLPLLLGAQRSPTRAFYQVPGEALRLPARLFNEEVA